MSAAEEWHLDEPPGDYLDDGPTEFDDLDRDPAAEAHALAQFDKSDEPARKSVATRLVELAEARYRLAVTSDGEPVAIDPRGPAVAHPLRGGRLGLRAALAAAYMAETGKAAAAGALADALLAIEGRCQAAETVDVWTRVAPYRDALAVDLGTPDGAAVLIEPGSWRLVERSPVLFTRSALTGALPYPARDGRDLLAQPVGNIAPASWPLVVGALVASLIAGIPHPVLYLRGEQGAGKTTTARRLVELVDPSGAPVRSVPRDLEQWIIAAAGSWVVALDNLSGIPGWLSDAICRAVTGEGMVRRRLYTDGELAVTSFRRVVLLTAIDAGALRGDLADRLLPVDLERIDTDRRRTDAAMAAEWERDRPALFAALLDLTADVLEALPAVHLGELPRMADYARVLAAIDHVRGDRSDRPILSHYLDTMSDVSGEVVADDPVASAVVTLTEQRGAWTGTATELLDAIATPDPRPRNWPGSARALSGRLRRAAPALRTVGVLVTFDRETGSGSRRTITLTRATERTPDRPSQPSPPTPPAQTPDLFRTGATVQPSQPSPPTDHEPAGGDHGDGSDHRTPPPSHVIDTTDYETRYADEFDTDTEAAS